MDEPTLCWDCAYATGGCRWSDKLKPVKGWTANRTHKKEFDSWVVIECPELLRDARENGLKRLVERRKDEDDE